MYAPSPPLAEHGGSGQSAPRRTHRTVALWLLACAVLVAILVVVGGATRLTRSGLSIVEWQPLIGALPPLSEADWQAMFAKYRETPEYRQVNRGMSLEAFKGIFWWEYAHRLLGRLIGIAFIVPLAWFWWRGRIDRVLGMKLLAIFGLGALQGAMGWYMVKSGLVDEPRVSHFRLAAHLGLACLIYAAILWVALDLVRGARTESRPQNRTGLAAGALALSALTFVMILSGALVAGTRAGSAYNTFPLMNGHWIPPEIMMIEPWWRNFFYNLATVQFDHRLLAYVLLVCTALLWWRARRKGFPGGSGASVNLLALALVLQVGLGIATLVLAVPVLLGVLHQAGAILVFTLSILTSHALWRAR